jgi:hypothetical protein
MAVSGALTTYCIIVFLILVVANGYLVRYFARPGTPPIPLVLTYLSWLITLSICLLVPIDILPETETALDTVWSAFFWSSFLLMWVIIPFFSGYYDNGGFTVRQRTAASLRFNAILILCAGIVCGIGLLYLLIAAKMSIDDIGGMILCASTVWGLTLLVITAGWGLVAIPRALYRYSSLTWRRDYIYFNAASIHHEREETLDEFAAIINLLHKMEPIMDSGASPLHLDYFRQIQDVVRERQLELEQAPRRAHPAALPFEDEYLKSKEPLTTRQLMYLHHHCRNLVRHLIVVDTQWRDTVNSAQSLDRDIQITQKFADGASSASPSNASKPAFDKANAGELGKSGTTQLAPITVWVKTSRGRLIYLLFICCCILSALILFCEITIPSSTSLSPLGALVAATSEFAVLNQIFCVIPLMYLTCAAFYPLFQLRLGRFYYVGVKSTDTNALLFNSTSLLRVATPLAYNFVLLLRIDAQSLSALIGNISVIPFFGGSFNNWFPIFLAIISILELFNIFARIGVCFNIPSYRFLIRSEKERASDTDIRDLMDEGRMLIANELRKLSSKTRSAAADDEARAQRISQKLAARRGQDEVGGESSAIREWKREIEMERSATTTRPSSKMPILSEDYDEVEPGRDELNSEVHLNFGEDDGGDDLQFDFGSTSLNDFGDEIPLNMGFTR